MQRQTLPVALLQYIPAVVDVAVVAAAVVADGQTRRTDSRRKTSRRRSGPAEVVGPSYDHRRSCCSLHRRYYPRNCRNLRGQINIVLRGINHCCIVASKFIKK